MTARPDGVLAALAAHAAERPSAPAVRSKRYGLWHVTTYAELRERVGAVAAGLRAAGAEPGAPVALIGENSVDWIVADLAIQAAGCSALALAPQTPADAAVRVLAGAGAAVVICGDQEHVDLVLDHADALAAVRTVVVIDPTGTSGYDARLRRLADVEAQGRDGPPAEGRDGGSVVMVSAGTGGDPRPAAHSPDRVAAVAADVAAWLDLSPKDRGLCVLPLALPTARVTDVYAALVAGAQISVPESPATTLADLREVEPTVLVVSPRALELIRQSSERRARESSRLRRAVYGWGMRRLHARLAGSERARSIAGARRRRGPAWLLVGRFVARDLGLLRTRRVVVARGPAARRDARFLWALGIPVLETYGQAELAGPALAHASLDDANTAGRPLPGVRSKLLDDGTLALATPATAGEWHETGDLAEDAGDGRIRVRGRREDVLVTSAGEVMTASLETALCDSAFVRRAVVARLNGDRLTALVEVDADEAALWASERDLHFNAYGSLVSHPQVRELIAGEVAAANERIGSRATIAAFVVLPQQLSVAAGELTCALTVRRAAVVERYGGDGEADATEDAQPVPSAS